MEKNIRIKILLEIIKIINRLNRLNSQYINEYRNILIIETDELFTLEPENILEEINIQINKTLESNSEYISQIGKFKMPDELMEYLNNFGTNIINPIFNDFKKEIDKLSNDQILANFEKNAKNY